MSDIFNLDLYVPIIYCYQKKREHIFPGKEISKEGFEHIRIIDIL